MRNIIFRGKRLNNGEWKKGYYVYQYGAHTIYLPDGTDSDGFDNYHVASDTVGQYTGFTDKNGTMIFEGDYVGTRVWSEFDDTTVWREGVVAFKNGGYVIETGNLEIPIGEERYEKPYFRIIGNVYDNPELLES